MSENNQIAMASQEIIDAAKKESHAWLNPETWRMMQLVAQTFLQSGAMPKGMDTAPKLIVALQAGKEAGLQPLEAINGFYFVNGKVSMYGEIAISQVLKAGHKVTWGECNAETATVTITRGDNGSSNSVTFTMKMAQERGLTSNQVYKKYPENMLRFKAFHSCAKFIVADALHGIGIKEVEEAEAIEVEAEVVEKPKARSKKQEVAQAPAPVAEEVSLEDAINKEDAEPIGKMQIASIKQLAEKKGKDINSIAKYYGREKIEDMSHDQAKEAIELLKKAPDVTIEEMPAKEKKTKKAAAPIVQDAGGWPEDVCRYLRFVEGIQDADLPPDIINLKKDAVSGIWKGYEAYPDLKYQISTLPEDFN